MEEAAWREEEGRVATREWGGLQGSMPTSSTLYLLQPPTLQEDSSKQVSFLLSHRQERAFRMPKR